MAGRGTPWHSVSHPSCYTASSQLGAGSHVSPSPWWAWSARSQKARPPWHHSGYSAAGHNREETVTCREKRLEGLTIVPWLKGASSFSGACSSKQWQRAEGWACTMDSWRPKPLEEALEPLRIRSSTSATSSRRCVSLTSWHRERSTSRLTPPWKLLSNATTPPRMRTGSTDDAMSSAPRPPCAHFLSDPWGRPLARIGFCTWHWARLPYFQSCILWDMHAHCSSAYVPGTKGGAISQRKPSIKESRTFFMACELLLTRVCALLYTGAQSSTPASRKARCPAVLFPALHASVVTARSCSYWGTTAHCSSSFAAWQGTTSLSLSQYASQQKKRDFCSDVAVSQLRRCRLLNHVEGRTLPSEPRSSMEAGCAAKGLNMARSKAAVAVASLAPEALEPAASQSSTSTVTWMSTSRGWTHILSLLENKIWRK